MKQNEKQQFALEKFAGNLNCAQSVLTAYCDELELSSETAERMGSAFGAGMGEGEICGAVSGALMVLGLKFGKADLSSVEKGKLKAVFEHFKRKFEETHGDLKCKNLLGLNIRQDEHYRKAHDLGLFKTSCPRYIESAIGLIEETEIDQLT